MQTQTVTGTHNEQPASLSAHTAVISGRNYGFSNPRGEKTKNRGSLLLVDASRDFCRLKRPESNDIEKYKELFYQLVGDSQDADRRKISAMLARVAYTPRQIALYLSQDRIEIAAPFLLFSPVLSDRDLKAISLKMGPEYSGVIQKRVFPTKNVKVDEEAISDLSEFAPEIGEEIAESDTIVPAPVPVQRQNDELLKLAARGGKLGRQSAQERNVTAKSNIKIRPESSFPKQMARKLLIAAKKNQFQEVADLVYDFCELPQTATLGLIQKSDGKELLYLVKALGLAFPNDLQLILVLRPDYGRDYGTYREAKSLLNSLESGICKMIFNEIGAAFHIGTPNKAAAMNVDEFDEGVNSRRSHRSHSNLVGTIADNRGQESHQADLVRLRA